MRIDAREINPDFKLKEIVVPPELSTPITTLKSPAATRFMKIRIVCKSLCSNPVNVIDVLDRKINYNIMMGQK